MRWPGGECWPAASAVGRTVWIGSSAGSSSRNSASSTAATVPAASPGRRQRRDAIADPQDPGGQPRERDADQAAAERQQVREAQLGEALGGHEERPAEAGRDRLRTDASSTAARRRGRPKTRGSRARPRSQRSSASAVSSAVAGKMGSR